MIVSNRKGLANRTQRIFKVNDFHIPVGDATRDLGVDAAGGRQETTQDPYTKGILVARRRLKKGKSVEHGKIAERSSSTPQAFGLLSPSERSSMELHVRVWMGHHALLRHRH